MYPYIDKRETCWTVESKRGVKLVERGLKILERVADERLRKEIEIHDIGFRFMKGRETTDLFDNWRRRQWRETTLTYCTLIDLDNA